LESAKERAEKSEERREVEEGEVVEEEVEEVVVWEAPESEFERMAEEEGGDTK